MAVEAGIGRSSGINHSEIGLELDERIIPGLNGSVNNTRVKISYRASVTGASVLPRPPVLLDNTEVDQFHVPIRLAPTGGFRFTRYPVDGVAASHGLAYQLPEGRR